MNQIKRFNAFVLMSLIIITPLLINCPGELPPQCCPRAVAFVAQDPWVCPPQCPGGGKTRISYTVEFLREGEPCKPPKEFTIYIRNLTDDIALPPLIWDNPKVGVYSGFVDITLQKDTAFELKAKGGDLVCGEVSGKLTVKVVDEGDFHGIKISGRLDPPNCTLAGGYVPFGPGVLIDHIYNPTDYRIRVTKDGADEFINSGEPGYGFKDKAATGNWSLSLNPNDCSTYANLPKEEQVLEIVVYLKCNCP